MKKIIILIMLIFLTGCTAVSYDSGVIRTENGTSVISETGLDVNIKDGFGTPLNSNFGALEVIQEYHPSFVNRHIFQRNGFNTTPLNAIVSDTFRINLTTTTGLSVGDSLFFEEGTTFECDLIEVTAINGNEVTLARPICNNYSTSALVSKVIDNMAGSYTQENPGMFVIDPPENVTFHIQRIQVFMKDQNSMDDSKFGGISALDNGVVVRIKDNDKLRTLSLWQDNGDIAQDMYDVTYSDKAGGGQNGLRARFSFNKMGYGASLNGSNGGQLEVLIQDNLAALTEFEIKVQGHIEE